MSAADAACRRPVSEVSAMSVSMQIQGAIALITLDRPQTLNALDPVSYTHLTLPTIYSV